MEKDDLVSLYKWMRLHNIYNIKVLASFYARFSPIF